MYIYFKVSTMKKEEKSIKKNKTAVDYEVWADNSAQT